MKSRKRYQFCFVEIYVVHMLFQLKCCGVDDVTDWALQGTDFQWDPTDANKPAGCCMVRQDGETMADAEKEVSVKNNISVKGFAVVDGEGLWVKLKP